MSLDITPVYPWPPLVYKAHFDGFGPEHIQACQEILSKAPEDGALWLELGDVRSSVNNQIIPPHKHPVLKELFDWQHEIAAKVMFEQFGLLDNFPYWISNSWVNVHPNGGETREHAHGLCSLSIAAYVNMPENGGFIEFKDPHFELKSLHKKHEEHLAEWRAVPAVTGDVLFFPGWLQHRTQANQSNEDRWVCTTNYTSVQYRKLPQKIEL